MDGVSEFAVSKLLCAIADLKQQRLAEELPILDHISTEKLSDIGLRPSQVTTTFGCNRVRMDRTSRK